MMIKTIVTIAAVLTSSLAYAEGTARDAQGMLSRLGYQISVDGSWGPQSQRVIGQFYTDRGLTYDGTLSENEFDDLTAATADLPAYVHPRAKMVNYAPQYDFPEGSWPYFNLNDYRDRFVEIYGVRANWSDPQRKVANDECDREVMKFDLFVNLNLSGELDSNPNTALLAQCLLFLVDAAHQGFITHGHDSAVLTRFFDVWVPAWVDNNAFDATGMRFGTQESSAGYTFAINKIAFVYTSYGEYWGVSPELDHKFRIWWDNVSQSDPSKIYRATYKTCREFSGPNINPEGRGTDSCTNAGLEYATALAHMGMYYKDSDYINEAIFVVGQSARFSSPEGFVWDGIRGAMGAGYMLMTTQRLDQIATIVDDIDVNLYEMSFANHGRTVRDIIEVSARELIKPDRIFDYSCPNERWYKISCYHQTVYSNGQRFDIDWAYSHYLRTISGALWNNPDYMPFVGMVNPHGHINGHGHSEGSFNRYIQLRYFPPRNQYYLQDPTPEDRNVYRGDLGSSEYIKMIVSGLEKFLDN